MRAVVKNQLHFFGHIFYFFIMPDVERTRAFRKNETWAEKLVWGWLRDRRFSGYKFRPSIRAEFTLLISFAKKQALPSNSTVQATAIPVNKVTTPNVRNS